MSMNANLRHERHLQRKVRGAKRALIMHLLGAVGVLLLLALCILGTVMANNTDSGLMFASVMGLVMGVPAALVTLGYHWSDNRPYEMFERAKYDLEDFIMDQYV